MVTFRVRSVGWFLAGLLLAVGVLWTNSQWRAEALPGPTESTIVSVTPERVLDTRDPVDLGLAGPFTSPTGQKLQITGSIPTATGTKTVVPTGATGVLLNVTAFNPSANGFISIRPGDATGAPTTSSLNVETGDTVPNSVQVALPTTGANAGKIDVVYDALGVSGPITDVLIDVVAYTTNTGLQEVNTELGKKADAADVYTKAETYTKAQVDAAIAAVPTGPMNGDSCTIDFLDGTIIAGYDERGTKSYKCFRALVSTLAGGVGSGLDDGTHYFGEFFNPQGVAVGPDGIVYATDFNHRVRRITPGGTVTTLAGSGVAGTNDGNRAAAQFNQPNGIAVGPDGTIYVADSLNHRIRKISPLGEVSTLAGSTAGFADGTGAAAQFNVPIDLAVAADGTVYVSDLSNNRIRAITPAGVVTTLAGSVPGYADGTGTAALFAGPDGIEVAPDGTIYVADRFNFRLRKVTPAGVVTTVAGSGLPGTTDGVGTAAQFSGLNSVEVGPDGNIYAGDSRRIRRITPGGSVTTIAGSSSGFTDGVGTAAEFASAKKIAVANDGTIYVADPSNNAIRKID